MNKKVSIFILIILVLILVVSGFYYYQISAVKIDTPKSVSYSGKLMPNFGDPNISFQYIGIAENRTREAGLLLDKVKQTDFNNCEFLHRQFLENMVELVENKYKEANNKLEVAKEQYKQGEYFQAGENAYLSSAIASTLPGHLNKILEGRIKDEWTRVAAIENGNLQIIGTGCAVPHP